MNFSIDVDENVTGPKVTVLLVLGCQGLIGTSAGLFLIVFLASLNEKKPPTIFFWAFVAVTPQFVCRICPKSILLRMLTDLVAKLLVCYSIHLLGL